MLRFIDITMGYEGADCPSEVVNVRRVGVIVDTRTDRCLHNLAGQHVLMDLTDVVEAAGERSLALVPDGFFDDAHLAPQEST